MLCIKYLTLYQTTKSKTSPNSKHLQTNKCDKKLEICFEKGRKHCGKRRKHCGKRRKCWFPAFSPFATMFSKGFLLRVVKSRDCVGKS